MQRASVPPTPSPATLPEPRGKVLCFARERDWNLARARMGPTPMRPDGRLELREPAKLGDRLVRPIVFLGRAEDGRLSFLCDVLAG